MTDTAIDLLQALGEQVEGMAKHITRLDDLTRTQAKLIEHLDERLVDVERTLAAQAWTLFGQNIFVTKTITKSIDDITFFLPPEARQTLRQAHAQANQNRGGVPL